MPGLPKTFIEGKKTVDVNPDDKYDEIALRIINCQTYPLKIIGIYKESRRGALNGETVHHVGYRARDEQISQLRKDMRSGKLKKPTDYVRDIDLKDQIGIK